jgi:hypothetical protein
MSKMVEWAKMELDLIGLTEEDPYNGLMRKHILHMLNEFAEEGHSGFSANYAADILSKLFKWQPISPLTGKDDEWCLHDTGKGITYQNNRDSRVFKDGKDGKPYFLDGIVFYRIIKDEETGEESKSYFTCGKSRVDIEFPYVPKTEYKEWKEENE